MNPATSPSSPRPHLRPPSNALALLAGLTLLCSTASPFAQPRVLPTGTLPADTRLAPPKDLNGYFPFIPSSNPSDWNHRATLIRQRIQISLGLWPLPTRTPLHPVIHGRIDRDDYTVEKVYFESAPGFFVTGNLYRPRNVTGRAPGVLCPHGHWSNGRFLDTPADAVQKEIASGAEQAAVAARSVLQARCVQLARLGCVVFHFDMLGYADSTQIPMAVAHEFAKQRPEMNQSRNWGLFSPQAESHAQSVMGLQTWNSIRALDFLCSLKDVDSRRIAVTGASGGGTQTFILCALDSRPATAFPAVMVSTAMQGGCTCENASGLRLGTGNVEFAALFAPKPLGLTTANDWTREMPSKGFPELQAHYTMLDAPRHVTLAPLLQFDHNYNLPSRQAMYSWFNQHLHLNHPSPTQERGFQFLSPSELTVWDALHPAPAGGPDFERQLLSWFATDAQKQLLSAARHPSRFRKIAGPAIQTILGTADGLPDQLLWKETSRRVHPSHNEILGLLQCPSAGIEIPIAQLEPPHPGNQLVLWLSAQGKASLWNPSSSTPTPAIAQLLNAGITVIGADLFMQGEFCPEGQSPTQTRTVNNPREAAAYTLGYNPSLFAQRVQDILRIARWLNPPNSSHPPKSVFAAALDSTGPWLAAARAASPNTFQRCAIHTAGFRFAHVPDIRSPDLLPGGAKYLDLPGMLALGAPTPLWLAGEGTQTRALEPVLQSAYRGHFRALHLASTNALAPDAIRWLVRQ